MRVRLTIECEHGHVGALLAAMPASAVWQATRAPALKGESPVRQMVMDAIQPPKPQAISHKVAKERDGGVATRDFILGLLAQGPKRWSEIINAGIKQNGWARSRVSSGLIKYVNEGLVHKDEDKLHSLTEKGRELTQ